MRALKMGAVALWLSAMAAGNASAGGLTLYLPLKLEPEVERQIERVLILADEPILKRPFAVSLIEDALPQACAVDRVLCEQVRRYLQRYTRDYAVTHASATGAYTSGAETTVPNAYGMQSTSNYEVSVQGYVQPSDYLALNLGGIAYAGRANPTGTMLSMGFNWAQLDVGWRPHWLSPMTDSSTLFSTEAPTTPSVTLSNYEPLTRLGFQYEFYWTYLSKQPIRYNGTEGTGYPHLFGTQFSIEPFPGWSVGFNRNLEYGGCCGLPGSAAWVIHQYFQPSGQAQTEGNQQASYISRFLFPAKTPFAVYVQYAGEDNSNGGSYLLGNASLSAGIDFPRIAQYLDLTYEFAEWQNIWYVHNLYLDGMTNDHFVLGNWGADQRVFNDGVGARSMMLRVGWHPSFGGYLEEQVRTLVNQNYYGGDSRTYNPANPPPYPYHHYVDFTIRYSHPWNAVTIGGEVFGGRDIDGKNFARISAFVRYGGDQQSRDNGSVDDGEGDPALEQKGAERFVDLGVNVNSVIADILQEEPHVKSPTAFGGHVGIGARRAVSENNDLGVRLEFDSNVDHHTLLGVRAIDYRYRWTRHFATGAFVGVARYDLATPAYSVYGGIGLQWRDILPKWDVGADFRYAQAVARDHVLPSDPQGVRPESFYKIETALFYVSRRF